MDACPEVCSLLRRLAVHCGYLSPSCSPVGVVQVLEGVPQQREPHFLCLPPGTRVCKTGHEMLAFVHTVSIFCFSGKGAWLLIPFIYKKVLYVALRESRIVPYPRKGFFSFLSQSCKPQNVAEGGIMINVSPLQSRQPASLWHIFASVKENNKIITKRYSLCFSNLLTDY